MEIVNAIPKRRGRPPGSKNKPKIVTDTTPKRRGRPLGSKNKGWDIWECPSCQLHQETMPGVIEVAHHCPNRDIQPPPAKGKKKLPVIVNFINLTHPLVKEATKLSRNAYNQTKREARAQTRTISDPTNA